MNILITGSTGFIGSHLTRGLSRTHHVLAPSHKQLDVLDESSVENYFRRHTIDVVVNAAVVGGAGTSFYKRNMLEDNLRMFFNLVRVQRYVQRIIHIGSGAVYDKRFPIRSISENKFGSRIPTDEYGLYKFICSDYIKNAEKFVDLRVFGIFGEGENYRFRFISNAICRSLNGLPITMKQNVVFDYFDVTDFATIVEYFITHAPRHNAYNIGSGRKIDLLTIAQKILRLQKSTKKIIVSRRGMGNEYTPSISRLRHEFPGFRPTPIDESLARLYAWYEERKKTIRRNEI